MWLVDLDKIPALAPPLRWITGLWASDHFGDPQGDIRSNVDAFLAANGRNLHGGRVLMLAQARTFGHVFDPLSLFWCHRADGTLDCVIAEVRNTFNERHCYLLPATSDGRCSVDKEFYVSPYFTVDGRYLIRWRLTESDLSVAFVLRRSDPGDGEHTAFVATLHGHSTPARPAGLLGTALRHPLNTYATTAAIHYEAEKLRRLGLPLRRRRHHHRQVGV
jgi:DUF1365 family protein